MSFPQQFMERLHLLRDEEEGERRRWGRKDDRVEKWLAPKTTKGRDRRRTAGMRREAGRRDELRWAQRFRNSTLIDYNICRTHNYTSQQHEAECFSFPRLCAHCVIRPNGAPLVCLPAANKKMFTSKVVLRGRRFFADPVQRDNEDVPSWKPDAWIQPHSLTLRTTSVA